MMRLRIFLFNLGLKLRRLFFSRAIARTGNGGASDDGFEGTSVPAPLKPPPPVLIARAAQAIPGSGDGETVSF